MKWNKVPKTKMNIANKPTEYKVKGVGRAFERVRLPVLMGKSCPSS